MNPANKQFAPYVKTPLAIDIARDNGSITIEQYDILVYAYRTASLTDYQVHGYSAANVCRYRRLDATPANRKIYQRAAFDLWQRDIIRRDYYQIDTRRSDQQGRPYSIWVPYPERFWHIGTPAENTISLWKANVAENVPDNVAEPNDRKSVSTISSRDGQTDNVAENVPAPFAIMSLTNHYEHQNREKEPLNPPSGDFSPAPLPLKGEDAQAAGRSNPHRESTSKAAGKENPLDAKQCAELEAAVLAYVAFVLELYSFSPNADHVRVLLRAFMPTELLFAQISRFSPWTSNRKNDMAHFFRHAAKDSIKAARLQGPSTSLPDWFRQSGVPAIWKEHAAQWDGVLAAWNTISPERQDVGFSREYEAMLRAAEESRKSRVQQEADARSQALKRQQESKDKRALEAKQQQELKMKQELEQKQNAKQDGWLKNWAEHCEMDNAEEWLAFFPPPPESEYQPSRIADAIRAGRQRHQESKQRRAAEIAEKEQQRRAIAEEESRQLLLAEDFLKKTLQDGEFHPDTDVINAARAIGIDACVLMKARDTLACVERETGKLTLFGRAKEWQLPTGDQQNSLVI